MKKILLVATLMVALCGVAQAQVGAGTKTITRHDPALRDSLSKLTYPYIFPLLGERVIKRGFSVPDGVGIMINGLVGKQDVTISDVEIGFRNPNLPNSEQMYNIDSIVNFSNVYGNIQNVNARVDVWLFPFLNVYGIFGKAWTQTSVTLSAPVHMSTTAKFDGYIYGFGLTAASGLQYVFLTLDFNSVWTHFSSMNQDIHTMMLTPRVGHTFQLGKESNIALWVGGTRMFLNRTTSGNINLGSIVPDLTGDKLDVILNTNSASEWNQYHPDHTLSPLQYQTMKTLAQTISDKLPDINQGIDNTTVMYSLNKHPKSYWTACVGAQYQLNPAWQFRTEIGLLGGRTSGLLSVNYRFKL